MLGVWKIDFKCRCTLRFLYFEVDIIYLRLKALVIDNIENVRGTMIDLIEKYLCMFIKQKIDKSINEIKFENYTNNKIHKF